MVRTQSHAILPAAILLATISLSVTPALAQTDGRWAVSLGGGLANDYIYRTQSFSFGDYRETFGFSGVAVAGAAYRLTDHTTLRMDLGYVGYQRDLRLNFATPTSGVHVATPTSGSLSAQVPFLSAGVRVFATGQVPGRPRLYVEASPTLWVTRWRERADTPEHYDLSGNYYPARVDQDAFTTLEPGFTAGAGLLGPLVGRTKLDVGMRYLFSTGAGQQHLGQYSSGDFKGLRQVALVMSLHLPM